MSQVSVYAYFDASGVRKYVDDTDFNFTGTWSAFGSYVAEQDAVVYSDTKYLSIITNVGANPQAPVTRTQPAKWSTLALLYQYQGTGTGTDTPGEDAVARALALEAYILAQVGTNIGSAAYDLAEAAYQLAQTGTNAAQVALSVAQTGTAAAASAQATADAAYLLAQIGTNTGTAAYDLAQAAYQLAISGSGSYIHDAPDTVKDYHIDWGSGTGQVSAVDVPYANTTYASVAAALDFLLYVPTDITSFTNGVGTVEIGTTVNSIQLDWVINKGITSQTINQGIGSLATGLRTYTDTGVFTTTRAYTVTASDGSTSDNANTTVSFLHKRYWGVSSNTSLTDPQVLALSNEFSTSRSQSRTFTPSAQYIYFAYPTSFGAATFTVNGLLNTAWTLVQRAFINASGYSENFNIYRSDNLLTGTYVVAIS